MRSHRLRLRTAQPTLRPGSGVSIGHIAIRIAAPGARTPSRRAALLGSVCIGALAMLGPGTAHAVDGIWQGPGAEWTTGTSWSSSPTVPDDTASFANNGAPTSVTISNNAAINTIDFAAAAPAYSFTVQNSATFTVNSTSNSSSFMPNFSVSSGATLAIGNGGVVEIGSLAGAGALQLGASDPNTILFIAGSTSTTFSGVISGPGSIELDDAASLRLTGTGSVIQGDLDLCLCSTGSLTIDGGSLTVNGFAQGVTVEGGTLNVINGGTLQVGPTSGTFAGLLVASNMTISGPGSTVTVAAGGFTGIGVLGPGALTISNGGVLNSQGGAEVDSFFGASTVDVTGPGSQWNIGGFGLSVGGGTTGGVGRLTISDGAVVNTNVAFIGDNDDGSSFVLVTGTGSRVTATTGLSIGDGGCGCGPLVGTLAIADGGVVEAADTRILTGSTLRLGTGGLGGTLITPTILNDGAIVANFTDTLTLAADISGLGTLSKAGVGTLILAGNNSYTGGTSITGGFINFNSANSFGSGTITIDGGGLQWATGNSADISAQLAAFGASGTTFDTNGNNVTLAASLSGLGGLTKTGAGTMTLSGVNSYQGGTAINGGTLAVTAAANLGAASGGLAFGGGTLQFLAGFITNRAVTLNAGGGTFDTNGNNATLAGAIGGAGGLTKVGVGTMTLSGTGTYIGNTTVNAGTLQAGAANVFAPASAYAIANGATLDLASFNQAIGSLAGAGAVTLGTATLTTGNDNTSTTFSGGISGTGGVTKIGTGTLLLTGTSNYTGATTVNAGTLSVNGSIASSALTVNAGGTIGGNGIIGNTTINNGGTLSPGNSIGTLTVQGNLVMTAAAAYIVEVSPTNADRTNVTGTASLGGTVQAVFGPGAYLARTYTILSATGGSTGTFGSLTTSGLPAGFKASLSYTATDTILNLIANLAVLPNDIGTGGLSVNQRNVANTLDNFFNTGGTLPPGFLPIFGLTGSNLGNALSQLSGEAATGGQQVAFQIGNQFLGMMLDPFVDGRNGAAGLGGPAIAFAPEREAVPNEVALAYAAVLKAPPVQAASFEQRWSAWGGGYGGSNRTSGDPAVVGSHDLSARTAGFAGGLDYRVTPNTVVGVALAGGGTNWSLANGLGGGKSDAFQVGVYGVTRSGPAYLAAAFAFTNHWMSTDRFAFAGDHLTASFNAQSLGARVESGYRFATMFGGIAPYAAIQAQSFRTPTYRETDVNGGGFALGYNGRTATDTRSELGARFDRLLALNPNAALALRARLAWAHDWVSDPTLGAVFQALPGASFIVNGAASAKNSALASAGTELRLANGVTLIGKFDGEFASRSSTYAGTGTVRYTW
jgi:autotransporter-associated beta strand protein/T5SS/PEP-CTERM-associated repeat protein